MTRTQRQEALAKVHPIVLSIIRRLQGQVPDDITLGELVSAGALGALDALSRFKSSQGTSPVTFMYKRAQGCIIDDIRSRFRYTDKYEATDPVTLDLSYTVEFDNSIEKDELLTIVFRELYRLPNSVKRAVLLRYFCDCTDTEISLMVGWPVKDVKTKIEAALATVRERVLIMNGGRGNKPWC